MSHRLREPFGKAGLIVAICALVMALVGGAYAAESGSGDGAGASAKNRKGGGNVNKLIKRESRKFSQRFSRVFSKRFAVPGPPGIPGLQGPQGVKGDKGDDGDDGSDGSDGANGKSVVVGSFTGEDEEGGNPPGEPCELNGGTEIEVEGSGEVDHVCNGAEGPEGALGTAGTTLPEDATETGVWSVSTTQAASPNIGGLSDSEHTALMQISFPIPLSESLPIANAILVPAENTTTEHCSAAPIGGTLENPKAESGYLCVYQNAELFENLAPETLGGLIPNPFLPPENPFLSLGANPSGSTLALSVSEPGDAFGMGTWAVTG